MLPRRLVPAGGFLFLRGNYVKGCQQDLQCWFLPNIPCPFVHIDRQRKAHSFGGLAYGFVCRAMRWTLFFGGIADLQKPNKCSIIYSSLPEAVRNGGKP